jgi:hypothetical protein
MLSKKVRHILRPLPYEPSQMCTDGELTSVSAAIGSSQLLLAAWTFLVIDRSPNIDDAREIAVRLCLLRPNAATLALLDALAPHVDGLQPLLPLAKAQAGRVVRQISCY